jgi:hypothetical protein
MVGFGAIGEFAIGEALPIDEPRQLHAEMLRRINAVEAAVAQLKQPDIGIGHNQPPDSTVDVRNITEDLAAIFSAITFLKAQPPVSAAAPPESIEAATRLRAVGQKFVEYADGFSKNFFDSAGAEAGKWIVRGPALAVLGTLLIELSVAAIKWIQALPPS